MSLINQMLQDLEQRNAQAGKTEPMSGEVRTVSAAKPVVRLRLLLGILLLLSLGGAAAWMYQARLLRPAVAPVAKMTVPAPAASAPVVPPPVVNSPVPAAGKTSPAVAAPELVVAPEAPDNALTSPVEAVKHLLGLDTNLSAVVPASVAKPPAERKSKPSADSSASTVVDTDSKLMPVETRAARNKLVGKSAGNTDTSLKTVNPAQQSENFYRQSIGMMQMGRSVEAQDALRHALESNPGNLKARQTLIGLLVESRHNDEAMSLLQEGLKLAPEQTNLSMSLARMQVETGNVTAGTDTLERGLKYAGDDAEYHAFYAALMQRAERHDEAVAHYLIALRNNPSMPTWLVGIAISWQAQGKLTDAGEAYRRAKDTGQLSPQLAQFVDQRMKQIRVVH